MKDLVVQLATNEEELDQTYRLASRIFAPSIKIGLKLRSLDQQSGLRKGFEDVVLAQYQGKVIGTLQLSEREAFLNGARLRMGGVADVCVLPEYRGRGVGKKMINFAHQELRRRGNIFAALFTRRSMNNYYAQLGYMEMATSYQFKLLEDLRRSSQVCDKVSLIEGVNKRLSYQYALGYEKIYRHIPLSLKRPQSWWDFLPQRIRSWKSKKVRFFTIYHRHSFAGYLIAKDNVIIEASFTDLRPRICLSAFQNYFKRHSIKEKKFTLSPVHFAISFLKLNDHIEQTTVSWNGGPMIRILNKGAFKKISISRPSWSFLDVF